VLKHTLSLIALAAALLGSAPAPAAAATGANRVYRIMPLGDSITRGGGQTQGQYVGYRGGLQAHLQAGAKGFRYNFVGSMSDAGAPDRNHEGHGGWTIDSLAAHVDGWLTDFRPDIVLLHAGTNDLTYGDSPVATAGKLRDLIARIRDHDAGTKIFVARIIESRDARRQPATDAYQALIPGVVAYAGPNVYLVDQASVGGTDIFDLTHPNDFGYSKMAYNWYRSMNVVLGGGRWASVVSPYKAKVATICQIQYDTDRRRVCRNRVVSP